MPGGGVLARFYRPAVGVSNFLFARGVGNSSIKKLPGAMVSLGID